MRPSTALNASIAAIVVILLFAEAWSYGQAPEPSSGLKTKVRIHRIDVPVETIAGDLSNQSRLKVTAAEPIKSRKITLIVSDVTVEQALDAVTKLNGWLWRRTKPGEYVIARPTARTPPSNADIPIALQNQIPREIRNYLLLNGIMKKTVEERSVDHWYAHVDGDSRKAQSSLFESIRERLIKQGSISYKELTDDEQAQLLYLILFRRVRDYSEVLYDQFTPHSITPEKAVLELEQGRILKVNMYIPEIRGVTGFGAAFPP